MSAPNKAGTPQSGVWGGLVRLWSGLKVNQASDEKEEIYKFVIKMQHIKNWLKNGHSMIGE